MPITLDPPGFLDDFDAEQRRAWHKFISDNMDAARAGNPEELDFDGPREQFFNPARTDAAADAVEEDITWTAFPRQVQIASVSDVQRWRRADASRDVQDEYCEWSVERDTVSRKIVRVTFTCEGPEYWEFLAATSPDKALNLYRLHVSPNVNNSDIFASDGAYQSRNIWNSTTTNGAMHLIQRSNTLGAEIELAGGSSVVRTIAGRTLTGALELIQCGRYGEENRHSDPHIGDRVNTHARARADVTLANPVGLYFANLDTQGWQTPDGEDAGKFWHYTRGTNAKPVRAVFEVPKEHRYLVGDIKIAGRAIDFGAQIADRITMKLTAVATRLGASTVAAMTGCRRPRGAGAGVAALEAAPAPLSVAAVLTHRGARR